MTKNEIHLDVVRLQLEGGQRMAAERDRMKREVAQSLEPLQQRCAAEGGHVWGVFATNAHFAGEDNRCVVCGVTKPKAEG